MEWRDSVVVFRMRRAWARVAARLGIRRTGLRELRRDVRTCEYEDVHVMWEMLRMSDAEIGRRQRRSESEEEMQRPRRRRAADLWGGLFDWAPCNLCRNF